MAFPIVPVLLAAGVVGLLYVTRGGVGSKAQVGDEVDVAIEKIPYDERVRWVREFNMPVETKSFTLRVKQAWRSSVVAGDVIAFVAPRNYVILRSPIPNVFIERDDIAQVQREGQVVT